MSVEKDKGQGDPGNLSTVKNGRCNQCGAQGCEIYSSFIFGPLKGSHSKGQEQLTCSARVCVLSGTHHVNRGGKGGWDEKEGAWMLGR